jgi:hypothetical protein
LLRQNLAFPGTKTAACLYLWEGRTAVTALVLAATSR